MPHRPGYTVENGSDCLTIGVHLIDRHLAISGTPSWAVELPPGMTTRMHVSPTVSFGELHSSLNVLIRTSRPGRSRLLLTNRSNFRSKNNCVVTWSAPSRSPLWCTGTFASNWRTYCASILTPTWRKNVGSVVNNQISRY